MVLFKESVKRMSLDFIISGIAAAMLIIYLVAAIAFPEKF